MTVKKTAPMYQTSDGKEFSTQEEAERHDSMIVALRNYEDARKTFLARLAETIRTADGELFDLRSHDYYAVHPCWGGEMAHLVKIDLWWSHLQIEERDDMVLIRPFQEEQRRGWTYRIDELFAHEKNATVALIAAQEERIADQKRRIEDLKAKWGVK